MNEIIERTMTLPLDEWLRLPPLRMPSGLQHGQAKVYVRVEPVVQKQAKHKKTLGEKLNDENEQRFVDALKEAEDRALRERTDPVYREQIMAALAKCQEGSPLFGGIDGVEFQRKIRDEWEDRLVEMGLSDITD
jgi:hypothetical protein